MSNTESSAPKTDSSISINIPSGLLKVLVAVFLAGVVFGAYSMRQFFMDFVIPSLPQAAPSPSSPPKAPEQQTAEVPPGRSVDAAPQAVYVSPPNEFEYVCALEGAKVPFELMLSVKNACIARHKAGR